MNLRKAAIAVLLAGAAGLSACATATPYQPDRPGQSTSGGFSEVRLSETGYRVTFKGNTLTSRDTVERYLLYRSAELTSQGGYDWFLLDNRETDRSTRTYVDPDPFGGPGFRYGYWHPYWRYYGRGYGWRSWDPFMGDPFWHDNVDVTTVERFEASADITMGRGPAPEHAIVAKAVMADLGPSIQRPQ
jgi:hypothetical protein